MKGCLKKRSKVLIASAIGIVMTAMMAIPAFAHVTISPNEAAQGGYGTFSVKVPNESPTASTVKLELKIPTESPVKSVSVQPKQGWTYSIEKTKLDKPIEDKKGNLTEEVVSKITFEGGSIKPGEFDEFKISMGPLPTDTDSLTFKAIQTYDDGEVASWIDEDKGDGKELEHPAPMITLTKATEDGHDSATKEDSKSDESEMSDEISDSDSNDTVAYVGVGIGVIAVLMAAGALLKKK